MKKVCLTWSTWLFHSKAWKKTKCQRKRKKKRNKWEIRKRKLTIKYVGGLLCSHWGRSRDAMDAMLPVHTRRGGEHCVTAARAVAWENSWHFAPTPPTVAQRNDVWETNSGEIPYWWRVTSPIWVVLLIGWKFASTNHKHCLDLNKDTSPVWNFSAARFSDVISPWNRRWRCKMSAVF